MDHLTLSERVARVEKFLEIGSGMPVDRNAEPDYSDPQRDYNRRMSGEATDKVAQSADQAQMQRQQTAFEEIIARIQGCNDRVCLTADKLQKIGDRIMGILPENPGEEGRNSQRPPDGTLEHTFMALNWLDGSLSRLEQVALRLEGV